MEQVTAGKPQRDSRQGDLKGGKGARVIILNAITRDGMLCEVSEGGDSYLHRSEVYEPARPGAECPNAAWLWRATKKGIPDYHANMDSDGFNWWVRNRLVPAFRKRYCKLNSETGAWGGPKMVLMLDNAPYHHHIGDGGLSVKDMPRESIIQFCADNGIPSLKVIRDGAAVVVPQSSMERTKQAGGANLSELRPALKAHIQSRHDLKHLLETDLQKIAKSEGFGLLFTPPYSPEFQPIEKFWRDSKGFAAREWRISRTPAQAAGDLLDFWYGTPCSKKRGKQVSRYSAEKAKGLIKGSCAAMNQWVKFSGVRLSGQLGGLTYDASVEYEDDGSLNGPMDDIDEAGVDFSE